MSDIKYPSWQPEIQAALAETDTDTLRQAAMNAEGAIYNRLQEIAGDSDHHEERAAIQSATHALRLLREEKLNYPALEVHRVRILIADDQKIVKKRVRTILQEHPAFEVVGEADDGASAVAEARRLKPDVAILNINMPNLNGFQVGRQIKASLPECSIVILSSHADGAFVAEARKIGAQGYVSKSDAGHALVKAVESAIHGYEFYVVQ